MSLTSYNSKQHIALLALLALICSIEAKLLRRSRYYDDSLGGYDSSYPMATGERAIMTVRGARNPYDGSAPSKIAIEDNPYRGPYPRGVYDRLESGYGRGGRYPMYPQSDYGYSNGYGYNGYNGYNNGGYGGYGSGSKRRDFLDPDFGVKTSLNLASKKRNRCQLNTEADSEIPELGLDSGRINLDCDINPSRIADAAVKFARTYRSNRRGQPKRASSTRKKTSINIDSVYERNHANGADEAPRSNREPQENDEDDDDDD